ncbi:MAG: Mor transcription activator family protein [Nitrosomonas ureae]
MKLVDRYGGTCGLYIPKEIQHDHELAQIIGYESAQKICQRFGGVSQFDIPKAKRMELILRNNRIRQDRASLSRAKLALKYNLTERQISKILNKNCD